MHNPFPLHVSKCHILITNTNTGIARLKKHTLSEFTFDATCCNRNRKSRKKNLNLKLFCGLLYNEKMLVLLFFFFLCVFSLNNKTKYT